jgi:RNA polymerase sigma factor (sigma-70 family)
MTEGELELTHEMIARIQEGDRGSWDALWRRLHDDLLFVVRCRLGPELRTHLESEDILQSVALEALGEVPTFAPRGAGAFRHFLHMLVTRKIRDRAAGFAAKKRHGTVALDQDVVGTASAIRYHDAERYEALERALLQLEAPEREVVLLHRIDGLPTKEIATRMHQSDAAVRKLYSRALARLRELLGLGDPPTAPSRE